MAQIVADRVKETSTTTGSGVLTLAGALTGFRAFSAVCANADTMYYAIQGVDAGGNATAEWEIGLGTWGTGNLLTRTTVYASSNANALVTFSAGMKHVWIDVPASWLKNPRLTGALDEAAAVTLASAATLNIGATASNTINVTGTTGITSLGTGTATQFRRLIFGGALTLTHNATSLILPTAANITTAADDCAEFISLGGSNWKCINYGRKSGSALVSTDATKLPLAGGTMTGKLIQRVGTAIASAATVNLSTATGNIVHITGTTTITTMTVVSGLVMKLIFDGALILTNGAALILPGAANITTAAHDTCFVIGDGTNARIFGYQRANGKAFGATTADSATSATNATNTLNIFVNSDTSTTTEFMPTFSDSTGSNRPVKADIAFTYNPGFDRLTAGVLRANNNIGFTSEYSIGNVTGSTTVSWGNGQKQTLTLTGNTTVSVSAPPYVGIYQLRVKQDATGGRAVTWSGPVSTRWLNSVSAPAINLAANGETIVTFYYDGTNMVQSLSKVGA